MKTLFVILVMAAVGYFAYSALKPSKKPGLLGLGKVYYYPKVNIYYDVASSQYVYFDSSKKSWGQSKNFSEEQKLSLGEKAIIAKPSSPVWKNNTSDRIIYSVNLYGSTNDLKQKFYADSINSLPKVVVTPVKKEEEEKTEEKPKAGLKKFFEKIFKTSKDKEKQS